MNRERRKRACRTLSTWGREVPPNEYGQLMGDIIRKVQQGLKSRGHDLSRADVLRYMRNHPNQIIASMLSRPQP